MSNWSKNLDKLEKAMKEEINAGEISGLMIPFCRLALALVGKEGLEELAFRLKQQISNEGAYIHSGWVEGTVLCLLGDFLQFTMRRSEEDTVVIRCKAEKKKQSK